MKKELYFMNNEKGFFLPYVLFITAVAFIIVTTNITMYRNDLQLTENQIEQVKIETLFQMQREQFKQEIKKYGIPNTDTIYHFPDGIVKITIIRSINQTHELNISILTNKNHRYTIINTLTTSDKHPIRTNKVFKKSINSFLKLNYIE
ncbi:hypothetical protein [Oceanobacillus chungangensis]|uniref:Competence protein ComG n=1 Tax=Oceanobacillus chungangensis TaxID=1229152 RepID=A0A3D8Q0F4_9BACI|nr:hypothetical protein [Oceanobacillus chungangensis]RDW21930.1 hypothetical protein CWR45_00110 [Oceanobacillus chungangensis]